MALIICPECEGKVSSLAHCCPHCGYPISQLDEPSCETVSPKIGSTILFGTYRYGLTLDKTDIEWIVLKNIEKYCLVISKLCIEYKPYSHSGHSCNWKNSGIRAWLNNDFFNEAFSADQKNMIFDIGHMKKISDFVSATDLLQEDDKVFLLSAAEFKSMNILIGTTSDTEYVSRARDYRMSVEQDKVRKLDWKKWEEAKKIIAYSAACYKGWWLRSTYNSCYVTEGTIKTNNVESTTHSGIRPAMWLKF